MLKQANDQDWIQIARDGQNSPSVELTARILVVDDDPHFLRVLARILSGENFLVTSAAGACDALELLKSAQFDLVISDLRMPECDGLNFLESLRRSGSTIPVIILTAYGEVDTYLEAMNAGATEYLNKPIQSDELLKTVRACLRSRKNRRNTGLGAGD
jgi:DNA-binding NtrC family response regulator